MKLTEAGKIYCVGIGGIGVAAIARILKSQGLEVAGSDLRQSQVTDSLKNFGIQVFIGHKDEQLKDFDPDIVVYSQDVSESSAGFGEIQMAKQLNIPLITQAQAVGALMEGKYGVAVTGTNGKSTTTAILGLIMEQAGTDPSVLVGTMLSLENESERFRANARAGKGKYVVAESDEYHRKMLENQPQMIIITNIAEDHLDYYKNLADIKEAFAEYIQSLPTDGILIYNADDHNTIEVCRAAACHKFTFGIKHYADLQALNVKTENAKQFFDMHLNDEKIGSFELLVPGQFNIANALAASLAALKLGAPIDAIQKTLAQFAGTWRRFEAVGKLDGKPVISDYAHHPAGVEATIKAVAEFYPGKKVLTVFQPHHRNRTQKLFGEFVSSLLGVEEVIIPEIFDVTGREHGERISSFQLVDELRKQGVNASFAPDLAQAGEMIKQKSAQFDIILMMGAGDIDSLARKLVS